MVSLAMVGLGLPLVAVDAPAPLAIDLTTAIAAPGPSPYGPGTTRDAQGHELILDSRSFFRDGKPWIPVAGEFHYARYPQAEWRAELLKMKAGGINTVSTYVFWIHHEEIQHSFDWSGQRSLRDFLKLCHEVGLNVFVRMGPWCHGEVRNGGHPDWVQQAKVRRRSTDPGYLAMVEPFYKEQMAQMRGLLWKDGGPVIGIQLDNECADGGYLLALKQLAIAVGVDVPFYAMTGWQGGVPKRGLIPLFGGYVTGFWGGSAEDYRKELMPTDVRAMNDLGAYFVGKNPNNATILAQYPYACVEIGPGMMSSYGRRIVINPADAAALALNKLSCGNNMPGYYMYHGGVNPDGKRSTMHEDRPNQLPTKDYDFQTALGAGGQVREQFHLLRQQNLFVQQFAPLLARMPAYFPQDRPKDLKDFATLRWTVRADGAAGFLFFNNQQPSPPLPEHHMVQFTLKATDGSLTFPPQPLTIPPGSMGIFPVRLDCAGVMLTYATVQPLGHLEAAKNTWYFFTALDGIPPELALLAEPSSITVEAGTMQASAGQVRIRVTPGLNRVASVRKSDGGSVHFVVLTPAQGKQFYLLPLAGRDRAVLTSAVPMPDSMTLRLQAVDVHQLSAAIFPAPASLNAGTATVTGTVDGIFTRFVTSPVRQPEPLAIQIHQERPAGPTATSLKGMEETTWTDAAVYTLEIPAAAAERRVIMSVHYIGDAARLVVGDRLFNDHFFNGDAFDSALWRIPTAEWAHIRLKILPCSDGLLGRLPGAVQDRVRQAKPQGGWDRITVTTSEQVEAALTFAAP